MPDSRGGQESEAFHATTTPFTNLWCPSTAWVLNLMPEGRGVPESEAYYAPITPFATYGVP